MKRSIRMLCLSLSLLALFALFGCRSAPSLHLWGRVFKIGAADAILLRTAAAAVLVDTGEDEDAAEILEELGEMGVNRLDLLILTHYDKDHVGGADGILAGIPVERVLAPAYEGSGKQYKQYVQALEAGGLVPEYVTADRELELDELRLSIHPPADAGERGDNDRSLVIRVSHGEQSLLLPGDAEALRLGELLEEGNLSATLLKVPHHGRYNENSKAFLEAVQPRIAIVTDSQKNPASESLIFVLQELGAEIYQTKDGPVSFQSDGHSLWVEAD